MSKQINIGGRLHSTEQGNVITGANEVLDDTKGKKQNVINADVDAELLRLDQSKQNNLTFDNTPTESSNNPVKSSGVYAADKALSDAIEAILILIPSAATALNQLADKNFVNSSIATDTATFRGTSETGLSEAQFLEWANSLTHDMNDYVFWQTIDEAGNTLFKRYKWNGTEWLYEYTLNNSSFTADQWESITSGITTALVEKLVGLPTNAALQQALNGKQNALTFDNVPTEGSNNPVKSGGVYSAVKAEEDARLNLAQTVSEIGGDVSQIEDVVPAGATAQNKLVANASMEAYVASIIQNITASFTLSTSDGHITLTLTQVNGRVATLTLSSSDIASAQALMALTGRVSTAEGNITSLGGRVSTNETDIANLQQLYNDLQQSKPVPVTALPETGQQQGVIYRLAGTTSYADYMWDGTQFVKMAEYDNAIDDIPTEGSDNLVKSGGIAAIGNKLSAHNNWIDGGLNINAYLYNLNLSSNGAIFSNAKYLCAIIPISEGDKITIFTSSRRSAYTFFDSFVSGDIPSVTYPDGYSGKIVLNKNFKTTVSAPVNSHYLYIDLYREYDSTEDYYAPYFIAINNTVYFTSVDGCEYYDEVYKQLLKQIDNSIVLVKEQMLSDDAFVKGFVTSDSIYDISRGSSWFIPVQPGDYICLNGGYITFLKNSSFDIQGNLNISDTYPTRIMGSNDFLTYVVPLDCNFLNVQRTNSTGADRRPSNLRINGIDVLHYQKKTDINDIAGVKLVTTRNLFVGKMRNDYGFDATTGVLENVYKKNIAVSDEKIPVIGGKNYYYSDSSNYATSKFAYFFDAQDNFLGRVTITKSSGVTAPNNAAYCYVGLYLSDGTELVITTENIQFEEGRKTEYIPHELIIASNADNESVETYGIPLLDNARPVVFSHNLNKKFLNFSFITDTHYGGERYDKYVSLNNLSLFAQLANERWLDFCMHCGDIYTYYNLKRNEALTWLDDSMRHFGDINIPTLIVKGNHETNNSYRTPFTGTVVPTDTYYIVSDNGIGWTEILGSEWDGETQLYGSVDTNQCIPDHQFYMLAQNNRLPANAVLNPNDPYGGYFYVDYDKEKIRVIVVNLYTIADDRFNLSNTELDFLANNALTLPQDKSDYGVIVFSHYINYNLRHLLMAFINGNTYTSDEYVTPEFTKDFSEQGPKTLIACIHGHTHLDEYSNSYGFNDIGHNKGFFDITYQDTAHEYCMSVYTIDTDNKVIYETRIGEWSDNNRTVNRSFSYDTPAELT